MALASALLELKNVSKVYQMDQVQVTALKDISIQVTEGDYVSIMGPSGSGKTTLLEVLSCAQLPH